VKLNGAVLTPVEKDAGAGWLTFRPLAEQYRPGRNELCFRAARQTPGVRTLAEVLHVEAMVSYK